MDSPLSLAIICLLQILCFSCTLVRIGGISGSLVLELTETTFDAAISHHDYILVDFYTPWCGHCKRLSPELDAAAPALAEKSPPIILAKVNVEQNAKLASKYDVRAYPTLKFFIRGIPIDYKGPRKAESLSAHLWKLSHPDVKVLKNEAELETFMQNDDSSFPIFISFGMKESAISAHLAKQYKSKAWFLVLEQFSEKAMERFGFGKAPAIVAHSVQGDIEVHYGPFTGDKDDAVGRFVQQNLLPRVNEVTMDNLLNLRDHGRPIALAILRDDMSIPSVSFIRMLRDLAPRNQAFIFAHVDSVKFPSFTDTFHTDNKSILPRFIIWDGHSTYFENSEGYDFTAEKAEEYINLFLQEFKEGKAKKVKVKGPTLIESLMFFISTNSLYIVLFVIGAIIFVHIIWGSADRDYIGIRPTDYSGNEERRNPSMSSNNDTSLVKED